MYNISASVFVLKIHLKNQSESEENRMKNKAKKFVAALLTVLMLLSIAPMGMLEGTDLAEAFGTTADAAGLNKYCATAAAEWAKAQVHRHGHPRDLHRGRLHAAYLLRLRQLLQG